MKIPLSFILFLGLLSPVHAQQKNDFFMLGGELSNSATTSVADIDKVMPRMKALGLNTVLAPIYWEFLEPQEGKFDFTLLDRTIDQARENQLQLVLLWFGAWKNSMSCYAPLWFKEDTKRFPRATTADGKPLEIASCFSEEVFQADRRAFEALLKRVEERGKDVVIMIQVENEIGMLEDARDHAPLAEREWQKPVPDELISYLKKHQKSLHPWLTNRLNLKERTWNGMFGTDVYADEVFMAYNYAKYVGRLCEAGRKITQLPFYVNAAMNSRGRLPGQYPSAGPLAHLIDLWHAGAPQLLLLAPDIYDTGFKGWASQYALANNRLFIPETRCCANSGVRAMYAFGEHQALGFSPFAIDQASKAETNGISKSYDLLRQLRPLLNKPSWGLLFDQEDKERIINDKGTMITARHYYTLPWDARATDGSIWPEGGAMIIRLAANEYLLAGSGIVVSFATEYEKNREEQKTLGEDGFALAGQQTAKQQKGRFTGKRKGIGFVDEVTIASDGSLQFLRRHNGDQDHQGRHARISCDDWKILHIRLYDY